MIRRTSFLKAAILVVSFATLAPASLLAAEGSIAPEVSLTLQTLKTENIEGPDVERTYFTVGVNKVVVGQPPNTKLRAEDDSLVVVLTGTNLDGEIKISKSPLNPELELTKDTLKYRDAGAATVPRGAEQIEVQQPVLNPYPVNGWKSLGFTWTYSMRGRPMTRAVNFLNLAGTQLMVTVVASRADAPKVEEIARQFIASWWILEPRKK